MDRESLKKKQILLAIKDEARSWLDKEQQADRFTKFHDSNIVRLRNSLESDAFINDHNGYLLALGQLKSHRLALDAINSASNRAAKAERELEELDESLDN